MNREWKPGDVAMVLGERVMFVRSGEISAQPAFITAAGDEVRPEKFPDARPVVVIDPANDAEVESLIWHLENLTGHCDGRVAVHMQAALYRLAAPKPPKPDEPTGLGAVVEDLQGYRWVRDGNRLWTREELEPIASLQCEYVDVEAVYVLSEGVQS